MVISPIYNLEGKLIGFDSISRDITEQKKLEEEKQKAMLDLEMALFEIKTLRGFIPICSGVKRYEMIKIIGTHIEIYLKQHLDVQFTHGLCPECIRKYYPEYADEIEKKNDKKSQKNKGNGD
jgi:hypothetical protein